VTVYIEDYVPVVKYQGLNTAQAVDFSGAATAALPAATTVGGSAITGLGSITATTATAFTVASTASNYGLQVDESTSSAITGIKVKAAASGGGVAISALGGAAEAITIDAKGTGGVSINATGSGAVTLGRATTITTGDLTVTNGSVIVSANAKGLSFTGTGTNGGLLTNLYNAAASTLSGTNVDVKIMIGATPYYFTVYPTKA
jgi:hypothetical protein